MVFARCVIRLKMGIISRKCFTHTIEVAIRTANLETTTTMPFVVEFTTELQKINEKTHQPKVWSRTDPASMDLWMTAGPPTTSQRTAMQGRPDPGFLNLTNV